jgi:hypothetical protein
MTLVVLIGHFIASWMRSASCNDPFQIGNILRIFHLRFFGPR